MLGTNEGRSHRVGNELAPTLRTTPEGVPHMPADVAHRP